MGSPVPLATCRGRPLKLHIRGTAGCGKSLVALKAYRDARAAGRRPLLLCFNRALKEKMAHGIGANGSAPAGGVVETWFGAIAAVLKETGRPLDHSQPVNWDCAVEQVLDGRVPDSWRFDAVIVDEGQDFDPAWGDMLDLFATPDADRIWMDDPDQAIQFGRNGAADSTLWPPAGWTGLTARQNHRSPQSVARYIRELLPEFAFEPANPLPGMGVGVTRIADRSETAEAVGRIAGELVRRGLPADRIVVLSLAGLTHATLHTADRCGQFRIARFTGGYDSQGNQLWTEGQLRFDTIRRYKGQQDAAVILTDTDPPADPERAAGWRRLLFAALTRATERVEIVVHRVTTDRETRQYVRNFVRLHERQLNWALQMEVGAKELLYRVDGALGAISRAEKAYQERLAQNFSPFEFISFDEIGISRIIAWMLDPHSTHGQGVRFLDLMLKIIGSEWSVESANQMRVRTEASFKDGRFDISIELGMNKLVIENKPRARDQPNQLSRYFNQLERSLPRTRLNSSSFKLIYLTLDGSYPESFSIKEQEREQRLLDHQLYCWSYRDDLLSWLSQCRLQCQAERVSSFIGEFSLAIQSVFLGVANVTTNRLIVDQILGNPGLVGPAIPNC